MEGWNKAGFSVCGIDQQSHGFSESIYGFRCYVDSFDHYVEDVLHFARLEPALCNVLCSVGPHTWGFDVHTYIELLRPDVVALTQRLYARMLGPTQQVRVDEGR